MHLTWMLWRRMGSLEYPPCMKSEECAVVQYSHSRIDRTASGVNGHALMSVVHNITAMFAANEEADTLSTSFGLNLQTNHD